LKKKILLKAAGLNLIFALVFFSFSTVLPRPSGASFQERDLKDESAETRPAPSTQPSAASATTQPSVQKSEGEKEEKGGIYKVGRAFKKAGQGIKKGFLATGRAFKKVGSSIKGAFVGERPSDQTIQKPNLDHVGDEPESQPSS
jgi:hypothetical protein